VIKKVMSWIRGKTAARPDEERKDRWAELEASLDLKDPHDRAVHIRYAAGTWAETIAKSAYVIGVPPDSNVRSNQEGLALISTEARNLLVYQAALYVEMGGDAWSKEVAACLRQQHRNAAEAAFAAVIEPHRTSGTGDIIDDLSERLRRDGHYDPLAPYEGTNPAAAGATTLAGTPFPVFLRKIATAGYTLPARQEMVDKLGPVVLRMSLQFLQGI
jgi:hypothetical protein